jgi:predicted outer membrane repeat protein
MGTQHVPIRASLVALLAVLVFASLASPVAQATDPCRIRNLTQDSVGSSLKKMVRAARDGDRLWVRGTCVGDVVISKDLVIRGRGDRAVVTGLDRYRVFRIREGATVTLRDLLISHGVGPYDVGPRGGGGGVHNAGTLTLADSIVSRARAGEDPGGAITNFGTMTIRDSVIRRSRADWGGGIGNTGTLTVLRSRVVANDPQGIWSRGPMTITDSLVRDNAWGGIFVGGQANVTIIGTQVKDNARARGISKSGGGTLTLEGCLISGNSGGGISTHWGQLVLIDTTVTGNTATGSGGGIFVEDDTTSVSLDATSSVTGNVPDDCYGTTAC